MPFVPETAAEHVRDLRSRGIHSAPNMLIDCLRSDVAAQELSQLCGFNVRVSHNGGCEYSLYF